jgi:hypothetical protein
MFESRVIAVMSGMVGLSLWLAGVEPVAGGVTTRVAPGGDAIELEIPTEVGTQKETLPLYHSGKIHYFSAGIGQVEREAAYPPFPLKAGVYSRREAVRDGGGRSCFARARVRRC